MRVIVSGGRDFCDEGAVFAGLDMVHATLGPITRVFEGGQRTYRDGEPVGGADFWAYRWAVDRHVPWMSIKAEWSRWGSQAGPMRNAEMLRHRPHAVIAFPGGSGTSDMLNKACREGVLRIILDKNGTVLPPAMHECK